MFRRRRRPGVRVPPRAAASWTSIIRGGTPRQRFEVGGPTQSGVTAFGIRAKALPPQRPRSLRSHAAPSCTSAWLAFGCGPPGNTGWRSPQRRVLPSTRPGCLVGGRRRDGPPHRHRLPHRSRMEPIRRRGRHGAAPAGPDELGLGRRGDPQRNPSPGGVRMPRWRGSGAITGTVRVCTAASGGVFSGSCGSTARWCLRPVAGAGSEAHYARGSGSGVHPNERAGTAARDCRDPP